MEKLIAFACGILLLAACNSLPENEFLLTGKIVGKVPTKAYLQRYEEGKMKVLDSADFVNGKFKFTGSVPAPDLYYLQIGGENNLLPLFLENSRITVTAFADSLNIKEISGSTTQDQYEAFTESKKIFDVQIDALYKDYKAAENEAIQHEIEVKLDSVDNLKTEHIKKYVKENGNSMLAPYIIRRELVYYLELEELEALTNVISPDLKENKYTLELHQRIETLRGLQPQMPAPEFTQNDINGTPVNLSDFKGKYLLIDFWASWCSPCRVANPTIVAMYHKYSGKKFTILGVSMDSKKDKWIEAIQADGLTWSQVSTLEGWANPVGKKYAVNSIPHAILIDPEGNIVKRGIHADELDTLLGNLLN